MINTRYIDENSYAKVTIMGIEYSEITPRKALEKYFPLNN